uniref:Uncharacterized protein n=1 Tax=Rhizophora mucronata TaxID=61149 RepID=A0A2P2IXR0_RHIMU
MTLKWQEIERCLAEGIISRCLYHVVGRN